MANLINRTSDFPIFEHYPHVYLDSAATTHKPAKVIKAVHDFYRCHYGTVSRGLYKLSQNSTLRYEKARDDIAAFISARDSSEIIFTSGATEGINLVAHCFLAPRIRSGDEILISYLEHHANFIPWQQLAKKSGAVLKILPLTENYDFSMEHFDEMLSAKTKMVAFSHISNVTGAINPIEKIIEKAHALEIPVLIDGAQSIGHQKINVQSMDCDFFAFSGHKIYGPTGVGVLYGKKELLDDMDPYRFGGEMIMKVTSEKSQFKETPHRFEAGTPNIAGVLGLGEAIKYLDEIGLNNIQSLENDLTEYLVHQLHKHSVNIIGNPSNRSSIVSFVIEDIHPHDAATILDNQDISVRAGHHCAQPLMQYMNIAATVRASIGLYNEMVDIDRLIEGIKKVRKLLS